ncbi:FxsA family protein [Litoribacillus peritrichatus]|uniref:Membrane protein FxsA n=1 Tax=Litoribacillus peritrichatus TaxID=718191 RepID=A0ABP7MWL4_9GAMM
MRWLFLLFCTLPVIELVILLKLGSWLGIWPTVALILGTAFIGVNLLRQQGLKTLSRANLKLSSGQMPAKEMVEGIVLAVGGALLLTPGLVTDVIGFSCLLPGTRHMYIAFAMKRMQFVATQSIYTQTSSPDLNSVFTQQQTRTQTSERPKSVNGVIEGEFERKDK